MTRRGARAWSAAATHMRATPKRLYCYIFRRRDVVIGEPAQNTAPLVDLMPSMVHGGVAAVSEVGGWAIRPQRTPTRGSACSPRWSPGTRPGPALEPGPQRDTAMTNPVCRTGSPSRSTTAPRVISVTGPPCSAGHPPAVAAGPAARTLLGDGRVGSVTRSAVRPDPAGRHRRHPRLRVVRVAPAM